MKKLDPEVREKMFLAVLKHHKLPMPETEVRFAPPRRWRFDYAWPLQKVALEVEGGAYTRGRHTRGAGFIADMEKYNRATVMGWRVLRVTPDQLCIGETVELIFDALRLAA